MSNRPYIICDIDGTLADISHRRRFVRDGKKDWKSFLSPDQVALDVPNVPVIAVVNALASHADIRIVTFSGRNEFLRQTTEQWFKDNGVIVHESHFRADNDFRRDDIIKEEMFHNFVAANGGVRPRFVIDDRKQVVDMWIRLGVFVFDVAQGQGDF